MSLTLSLQNIFKTNVMCLKPQKTEKTPTDQFWSEFFCVAEAKRMKCRFVNDVLQNQKTWQLEIKDLM